MLPCLNKELFGLECLGCGIQRATAFLFKGEFIAAFKIYPAIYTLILLICFLVFSLFFKIKYSEKIKAGLLILNILIILINYLVKNFL
ncbi:DUF2752 domain-containing protein [Patiriisocius hiemis]|uniref:DUF2752 domain-containing protein n=1 Tax=Patiriisocius hiemis TaxID=3075604 RepID=A0ABU2YBI6_9FLAO|nr:DUF2752 domain-containing protein [Constantimarinum sp. W242]MDT0554999.1 DUF2752 domain-containing protein [Constantimarinum sp. W242]